MCIKKIYILKKNNRKKHPPKKINKSKTMGEKKNPTVPNNQSRREEQTPILLKLFQKIHRKENSQIHYRRPKSS